MTQKNSRQIIIDKHLIRQEWMKTMPTLNKAEVKLRKEAFILEKWSQKYPQIDYINYATIEELANRTEYVGAWMREQNAEFNAMITLPDWAAESLKLHEVERLKDKFAKVNSLNRQISERKTALSKYFADYSKKLDEKYASDLKDLMDGDEKAFILTYPKNQLPLPYVLSSIQFLSADKAMTENEKLEAGENYTSPSDYDSNLLDHFRKDLWTRHLAGEDIKEYIASQGVNFYIPTISVESGHLSNISHLLQYSTSMKKAGGTR